jgi:subtilase family serine protease
MKCKILFVLLIALNMMLAVSALGGGTDQAKQQAQANQANISLLLRPDLAIGKIWIVKAGLTTLTHPPLPVTVLKKGEKYLLYCQFTNAGVDLNGVWKLGYYIDGEMVWNQYWGNVPAGATQTKYFPGGYVPTTVGAHTYMCRLDYDTDVIEKDENNNKTKIDFTVIQ